MQHGQSFDNNNTLSQFGRFLICGGLASITNLAVGYFLYGVLRLDSDLQYSMSIIIAYCLGMFVNFILNRHFTFQNYSRQLFQQARTFFIVAAVGLALTVFLSSIFRLVLTEYAPRLETFSELDNMQEAIAHFLAIGLVSIYSFAGHKFLTFTNNFHLGSIRRNRKL